MILKRPRHDDHLAAEDLRTFEDRLEAEALVLARLQHPSIVTLYEVGRDRRGRPFCVLQKVAGRSLRARLAHAAMEARLDSGLSEAQAREETARRARSDLGEARRGLRALEVIATIAPLLGLLGTVLGMIAAFQTLQQAGAQADPAALAGGIWEALLTTAAGMAVAIPAGVALSWFESVTDALQADMEDAATRIFIRGGR